MAKQKQPGNLLPHNPLTAAGVLAELKRLKGNRAWLEFELELLAAKYPDNTIFRTALEHYTTKATTATAKTTTLPGTKGKAAKKTEAK
ncbi:MAG: hypothetical protein WC370_07040 [Dehalococcoidales bacterium]|jgi:hypothetical protein